MNQEKIRLAHGSGGRLSRRLIEDVVLKALANPILNNMDDSALLAGRGPAKDEEIAFTCDSYVIDPVFFPGGDIGKLAVCGTVNDLAMSGAVPKFITLSLILEEGFGIGDLKKIVASIKKTARTAGVQVVAGDTKVVGKGAADKIFINTAGIGFVHRRLKIGARLAKGSDVVIINGSIGDHGMAIMARRRELGLEAAKLVSDCAPLNGLTARILAATDSVHVMRDLTRGGLAAILNEIALSSGAAIELDEACIPVRDEVRGICQILGFDPLYTANEGKMVVLAPEAEGKKILAAMKKDKHGRDSRIIGRVLKAPKGTVWLKTVTGGRRIVDMPSGEQLPRIC